ILLALVDALKDPAGEVRLATCVTLVRFGARSKQAVPALADLLTTDKSNEVRAKVAEALSQIGAEAVLAVPQLARALADPQPDVRRWSALALSKIGADAASARQALIKVLKDEKDKSVRDYAVRALGQMGKDAVPALVECVRSEVVTEVR